MWGILCTAAILFALARADLLRIDLLMEAWHHQRVTIGCMATLQLGMAALSVMRYRAMLLACGVQARKRDAMAATLVSTGVSLWLPASAGVSEVLRVGLMCGADVTDRQGLLGRVSLASLLDRATGLILVCLVGTVGALALQWLPAYSAPPGSSLPRLAGMFLATAALLMGLVAGLARWARRADVRGHDGHPGDVRPAPHLPSRLHMRLQALVVELQRQRVRAVDLVYPTLLALLIFVILVWIYLLAIRAVGGQATAAAVSVMLPLFTLAGMLPISIGGLGGQQLAAIAVLRSLGCDPAAVASAGLLNAAVVLCVHSVLAGLSAGVSFRQLHRLLHRSGSST
ncbi:MAG: lysylphosphatidylglycerol synthase transmembrane domain-containing protein [Kiritimatiellae bacterium]|nr:lysylphosphatidylglycerol synthase transmembrane domain-containing protein [Kiritimatiellia bacterium]